MTFNLLNLTNLPILEQLRLEEALLRADDRNWCLINHGSPPAIVMGISGKPEKLLNLNHVQRDQIPIIKRFSGGGTVYIDEQTLFVTFICNSGDVDVKPQPKPILSWSERLYEPIFKGFSVRENDYVFGERKFGGNAQYIRKDRWLHHTSFLWDFEEVNMDYLLLPEKRPKYREERSHTDFLCCLKPHFASKEVLISTLISHLKERLSLTEHSYESVLPILERPHRKSTVVRKVE